MPVIYVLNKDGSPLMPVRSNARARRLLKSGKATIELYNPFTLRLTYQIENPDVSEVILGMDPGRTNIGLCAINDAGKPLLSANLETNNKDVRKHLSERKQHRQASRAGERDARKRRQASVDPDSKITEYWRMLPGYKKAVCCKVIRNQEAKFNHRTREEGWMTPTVRPLLDTHIHAIEKVASLLPISAIAIEINKFDFARMENPGIRNWEYQKGKLFGFDNVEDAVYHQQKGKCLLCGRKKIEYYHHIVPLSEGGSDSIDNRAGLCEKCHYGDHGVHKDESAKERLKSKKKGLMKKYHALSVINQIMPRLLEILPEALPVYITTGQETHKSRIEASLPQKEKDDGTHYMDAWCIAVSALGERMCSIITEAEPDLESCRHDIKQYRRHERNVIQAQQERTYYLNGKAVAKNRKKRCGQADSKNPMPSLKEFREDHPDAVAHLTVKKSKRSYTNPDKVMPGAIFKAKDGYHVLHSSQSGCTKFWAEDNKEHYYKVSGCEVIRRGTGLVFL